ncbi:chloride channel protein [Thalassotalea aquiviva]|uniref:chloride channel protein n=1 Tax=Thalassotalea aquiviva TaxID=3242415 RepID=UPI00352B2D52
MSLASLRKKLAKPVPSWQLCLLGIIGGALASLFIIIFRLSIESIQLLYLDNIDDFTTLSEIERLITPIVAVSLILLLAWAIKFKYYRMGIPFVIHRLKVAYGHIPMRNTITQFFGSIFALAGGFSVGREGPAVHIGAASSSFLGARLKLPKNAIKTMCACGVAAGISASFNTPLAAVMFVMEVILREYKMHIFVPVILASIIGSIMTNAVFGSYHDVDFFPYIAIDFWHYPLLILFGIALGFLGTMFNQCLMATIKASRHHHMYKRLILAALVMGLIGYLVPQSMGAGLTGVGLLVNQNPHISLIFSLLVAKFFATALVLGLGIPGGVIGPTLTIGAIAGAIMGYFVGFIYQDIHFMGDYALLGMSGMLAATLNAPLAALLTVIELSNQLELALPAMVVITTAFLTSSQFLKNRSIFLQQLRYQELPYKLSHVESSLQKYGVLGSMDTNIKIIHSDDDQEISTFFDRHHMDNHIISCHSNGDLSLWEIDFNAQLRAENEPGLMQFKMQGLSSQETLSEAFNILSDKRLGAVYIYDTEDSNQQQVIGILPFQKIRQQLTKGYK